MNLSKLTIQQLTDHYNAKSGKKPISKFRTKGEAVKRVRVLQQNLSNAQPGKDDRTITNIAPNPKRPGSASHARYALYAEGMTVEEFVEAGGTRADVNWDLKRGFIQITE